MNERIRDHVTRILRLLCVSELSQKRSRDIRIHSKIRVFKKRSPIVWRTMFVLKFVGPTISRASVKQLDHGSRLTLYALAVLTLNTLIYKAFYLRRSRVQSVVSEPL